MTIAEQLQSVQDRILAAAQRGGRTANSVELIAVSKRQTISAIREAYDAGCRHFGENYVQELQEKARALADLTGVHWHHIGGLQRNKVKSVLPISTTLHGVDSVRLLKAIDRQAAAAAKQPMVLLQVNLGAEASKSGCAPDELGTLVDCAAQSDNLQLCGLMTIPPRDGDPAAHFGRLHTLREKHGGAQVLPELSMGMSGDFELAIEKGATMVRVGSAIFGHRV